MSPADRFRNRRRIALKMRRQGASYAEIGKVLGGGKSIAYYWVHGRERWYRYGLSKGPNDAG